MSNSNQTVQKYPDGSDVKVDGHEWTVIDMTVQGEEIPLSTRLLMGGEGKRPEDFNLYRLKRHNSRNIFRWQHELDVENS